VLNKAFRENSQPLAKHFFILLDVLNEVEETAIVIKVIQSSKLELIFEK